MDKKPLLLRTLLVIVVAATFAAAMYPLSQRDYYEVFTSLLKNPADKTAGELVEAAKAKQAKDVNLFQSQALLAAADEKGVNLAQMITNKDAENNRDVMSLIRKKASSSIRLGLDLNGGVEFYLELVEDANQSEEMKRQMESDFNHYRDVAVETLRKRLEGQSIFEAEIAPSGERNIVLRAPLVTKDEKAKLRDIIQMSAKLEFRLVENAGETDLAAYKNNPDSVPPGTEYMEYTEIDNNGKPAVRRYLVQIRPEMTGENITFARAMRDEMGQRKITLRFNADGAEDFKRVTENNVGRQLAIVLDGKLYCAPVINGAIAGGSAEISGSFTDEEAKTIADALVSGSFPFKIEVRAVFDTDPTLGAASVRNGIWVGCVSMLFVALFMIVYYRFSGVISVVALTLNIMLILGAMAAFDCTLTLPGIAGIVLTIGMAVDANVLVFERIREELHAGKSLINAVNAGYNKALSAVLDSNITTLITSFILMYVGTGAIKGFAVTLSIGILSSLFSAIFVTRLVFDYLFRYLNLKQLSMVELFGLPKFQFVRNWKYALIVSTTMVILLIVMLGVRGKSILGIDFTGGTAITYSYGKKVDTSKLAAALKAAGYEQPQVTYKSNVAAENADDAEILQVLLLNGDEVKTPPAVGKLLDSKFPELKIKVASAHVQHLDGLIGKEFTKAALLAIVLALCGIAVYILLRYELSYAIASVLALMHDVAVVLAIYIASGRTIGLTTVAAFLTVIGYSINDTVVVFDRLRENRSLNKSASLDELVDLSINQSLRRTLVTSFTTFIVVFILWVAGGPEIADFVFVMMLGVILGTFSSICLAGPFVAWRKRVKALKNGGK